MTRSRFGTTQRSEQTPFAGFASPSANTLYCPNQFFDVVLRHSSRGCVRVVALLLRQTLGWSDRDGQPLRERHAISYSEFESAGIGKDTIKGALNEAIRFKFIRCISAPSAAGKGKTPSKGLYELNWDESGEYVKDPDIFRGFFAGGGHRTYVPNQFFDEVIPRESLSVVKVVGAVIRFSIGFVTKWGHRRTQIALSFTDIQRYARIASPATLNPALKLAMRNNYLVRVADGYFDPQGGRASAKACYGLKWLSEAADSKSTRENVAADAPLKKLSENRTGSSRKNVAEKHPTKHSGKEITETNNTFKQQAARRAQRVKEENAQREANAAYQNPDIAVVFEELKRIGFDTWAARHLAERHPAHVIMRQIELIERRSVIRNRLGLLRRAIEENWPAPEAPRRATSNYGHPKSRSPADGSHHRLTRFADLLPDRFNFHPHNPT